MDAMTAPAPKLRIIFAVVLVARFVESFGKRMLYIYPPEQLGLVPHAEGYLRGLGTSSRQSFVRSIDWTVLAMLGSSIMSVLLYPRELAVVRIARNTPLDMVSPTSVCHLVCACLRTPSLYLSTFPCLPVVSDLSRFHLLLSGAPALRCSLLPELARPLRSPHGSARASARPQAR